MLSISADAKTRKGEARRYLTGVLYLAPHTISGRNVCPDSTPGCREDCLFTAGRGVMRSVSAARINKTRLLRANPGEFLGSLHRSITGLVKRAAKKQMTPLVRLNGTSDIPWENMRFQSEWTDGDDTKVHHTNLMEAFPAVQFYDYTKSYRRMQRFLAGQMPPNYHLTFSRSECNDNECDMVLAAGGNVAVVFSTAKGMALPSRWHGFKVIDGDRDDVRHADNSHGGSPSLKACGVVIGLRAKGKARKDTSGFVVKAS